MAFQTLLANAVGTIDRVTDSLQVPVKHKAWISNDTNGSPVYATEVTRKGVVSLKHRLRRLDTGQEVLQKASVTFPRPIPSNGATGRREPIDPRDIIILPNGYTGPIINVTGVVNPDTKKPYAMTVMLG